MSASIRTLLARLSFADAAVPCPLGGARTVGGKLMSAQALLVRRRQRRGCSHKHHDEGAAIVVRAMQRHALAA
jgi:hypothetical protein